MSPEVEMDQQRFTGVAQVDAPSKLLGKALPS